MGKLLKIENLSKEGILSSVSFEMEEGEIHAFVSGRGDGCAFRRQSVAERNRDYRA